MSFLVNVQPPIDYTAVTVTTTDESNSISTAASASAANTANNNNNINNTESNSQYQLEGQPTIASLDYQQQQQQPPPPAYQYDPNTSNYPPVYQPPPPAWGSAGQYKLTIYIRTPTGLQVPLSVDWNSTVLAIKQQCSDHSDIFVNAGQQRLVYNQYELFDNQRINDIPIPDQAIIDVSLKLQSQQQQQQSQAPPADQSMPGFRFVPVILPMSYQINHAGIGLEGQQHQQQQQPLIIQQQPIIYPPHPILHPAEIALANGSNFAFATRAVLRSSLTMRLIAVFFVAIGSVELITGSTAKPASWPHIVIGTLLLLLSSAAAYTAIKRDVRSSTAYFISIIVFLVIFTTVLIVSTFVNGYSGSDPNANQSRANAAANKSTGDNSNPADSGLIGSIIVGIALPVLFCLVCVNCARLHRNKCRELQLCVQLQAQLTAELQAQVQAQQQQQQQQQFPMAYRPVPAAVAIPIRAQGSPVQPQQQPPSSPAHSPNHNNQQSGIEMVPRFIS